MSDESKTPRTDAAINHDLLWKGGSPSYAQMAALAGDLETELTDLRAKLSAALRERDEAKRQIELMEGMLQGDDKSIELLQAKIRMTQAERDEAYETAAKVCEGTVCFFDATRYVINAVAKDIRALKPKEGV